MERGWTLGDAVLTLIGVGIGAIVTLGVQVITHFSQKGKERREVIRAIAARALSASTEAWDMLHAHAIWTDQRAKIAGGLSAGDYLTKYTEAKRQLDLALDELSLVTKGDDELAEVLRESVTLGSVPPGRGHEAQKQVFMDAREALLKSLRPLVRP